MLPVAYQSRASLRWVKSSRAWVWSGQRLSRAATHSASAWSCPERKSIQSWRRDGVEGGAGPDQAASLALEPQIVQDGIERADHEQREA
jgi:hypothetical protein